MNFRWNEEDFQAAQQSLGFPAASLFRPVMTIGSSGLPVMNGTEALWPASKVEAWARAFAKLVRVTKTKIDD